MEEQDETITKDINAVEDNYEKVTITVDSGVADTVGPKHVAHSKVYQLRQQRLQEKENITKQPTERKLRITGRKGLKELTKRARTQELPFRWLMCIRH